MTRYLFRVLNPGIPPDVQGEDFPDDEAAWREATVYAGELLKDDDGHLRPGQKWALEIADEGGKPIFKIQISTKKK